jgi:hypothetical protein
MAVPQARTAAVRGAATLRRLSSSRLANAQVQSVAGATNPGRFLPVSGARPSSLTDVRQSGAFFDATGVMWVGFGGDKPPDPNKSKLGKTLRILQERLPTLLQYPLPLEILAPNISLHLFPSTHPHLPTVSGRVAYNAALWTTPIAWNRVPIVGNVRLEILAERMTSEPVTFLPRRAGAQPEQLIVRWCDGRKRNNGFGGGAHSSSAAAASTSGSTSNGSPSPSLPETSDGKELEGSSDSRTKILRPARAVDPHKEFTGIFIFDFDSEGRILTHTIEQASTGQNWDKGMGAKVVGLTDWLLGGIREGGQLAHIVRLPQKHR